MDGSEWLDEVRRRISERLPEAEASRPEPETLTLSAGLRVVVLHDAGEVVLFSPSFVAGGSIGSRLQDRVQHLDITSYGINEATVEVAVDSVLRHLRA